MSKYGCYVWFALSGMSALMYELLWQRHLYLLYGVSTLAVSTVLAAFMSGLALGNWWFGSRADRSTNPLRLYAGMEAAIALTALCIPVGFEYLAQAYVGLHAWLQPGVWGGTAIRFILAFFLLLAPATLIGGTMPVMGRLACRDRQKLSYAFGLLYGVNTLGAVVGTALTGFVLLRYLGMRETQGVAIGINALVAVTAYWFSRRNVLEASPQVASPMLDGPMVSPDSRWVLGCAAGCGASAAILEITWTRILGIFTSNSSYTFAMVLTVLLTGMGLGSLLQALWSRRRGNDRLRFALCQWLLAGATLASAPFLRHAPLWLERCWDTSSALHVFLGEAALTVAVILVPALLLGLSYPLLVAGLTEERRFGKWLGHICAANTLGFVVGSIVAGFILIPELGLQTSLMACCLGNLSIGLVAWTLAPRPSISVRFLTGMAVVSLLVLGWCLTPPGGYIKSELPPSCSLLYYKEGNNGTVSVMRDATNVRWLLVDGQPVAGTSATSVVDQKMLAHLPLLMHPQPKRALTVGFGSGGTSHSMTLHGIEVDCVEIERAVPAAADHFASENHGILAHPRFHLIVDDARSCLRLPSEPYDVIVTDCTNLQYKSNGDLYTTEYFQLMERRLHANGIAAAWVPANGIDQNDLKTLLRSFQHAFPHTSIWFMNTRATDFLIVIGTHEPLHIDADALRVRMAAPGVIDDLATVGLADPYRLLNTFLLADTDLERYLGAGPLNTDDCPLLSYTTYGANLRGTISENLIGLMACRGNIQEHLGTPVDELAFLRSHLASTEAVLGHIARLGGSRYDALCHYTEGAKLLPSDPSLRLLVSETYMALCRDQAKDESGPVPPESTLKPSAD